MKFLLNLISTKGRILTLDSNLQEQSLKGVKGCFNVKNIGIILFHVFTTLLQSKTLCFNNLLSLGMEGKNSICKFLCILTTGEISPFATAGNTHLTA